MRVGWKVSGRRRTEVSLTPLRSIRDEEKTLPWLVLPNLIV